MINDYKIKYAAMPVIDQEGWQYRNGIEKEDGVKAYIASKCYFVSEHIFNDDDGKLITKYGVVFPYQDITENGVNTTYRTTPQYQYNEQYVNLTIVDEIFDTLEEAKEQITKINDKLLIKKIRRIPREDYSNMIMYMNEEYYSLMKKYEVVERCIEQATEDLNVERKTKVK